MKEHRLFRLAFALATLAASAGAPTTTRVLRIYPSAEVLPENQAKFHILLSAPMVQGGISSHIRLLDHDGRPIAEPFRQPQIELWGANLQRLTVSLNNGHLKAGREYSLIIDKDWLDAEGGPLSEGYRKEFRTGPPDRTPPNPRDWKLALPDADTDDTLSVDFGEPLDFAFSIGR